MASTSVTVRVDTRWFKAWISLIRFAAPLLVPLFGPERVYRTGVAGRRLLRMKIGNGRWQGV